MTIELSVLAKIASEKRVKENQIIVEIDGCPLIFGAVEVVKLARVGDEGLYIGGFYIGGSVELANSRSVINLSGSTKNIQQQIRIDKGGSSSVSSIKISLVDIKNEISKTLNAITPDVLSKEAEVYLGFKGLAHPENSIRIFSGNIDSFETNSGLVAINISHPEQKKRAELLTQAQTVLTALMTNSGVTAYVQTTNGIIYNSTELKSYLRIDDEIMEILDLTSNSAFVDRAKLGTIASSHDIGADVSTFYQLIGDPIDLALKIMLSNPDSEYYKENVKVSSIVEDDVETIPNALFFNIYNIQDRFGFIAGDSITLSGSVLGNDFIQARILSWGTTSQSSYIVVDHNLVFEQSDNLIAKFKSQYNTLPFGCGLGSHQVDIEEHLRIKELFGQSFPVMDFYFKEGFEAKKFIEEQLYFPIGAYQIPRKGRASIGYTAPPLSSTETKTLSSENVINPDSIAVNRTVTKNFYNSIIYKYNEDALEDKLKAGVVSVSETSNNQIKSGQKPLRIEAKGLRNNLSHYNFIVNQSSKFLDRYQLGAESFTAKLTYGTGFNLEAGDIVIYDGKSLGSFDSKNNSRNFVKRLMQITNKSMDVQTGEVSLELTDTAYALNGRYATIGPSSKCEQVSTTQLRITQSQGTIKDYDKWSNYIGETVRIRNEDFTFDHEIKITGIDQADRYLFNTSIMPVSVDDLILELPVYSGDAETKDIFKLEFVYLSPQDQIQTATSTSFTTLKPELYFKGSTIFIHKADYSTISKEFEVLSVVSNTITINGDFGFTPDNTYFVDLIGFSDDEGKPYRVL